MTKVCPKCNKRSLQKYGKDRGCQKYKCTECSHMFRNRKRIKTSDSATGNDLLIKYSVRKQTLAEIAEDLHCSKRTVHRKISTMLQIVRDNLGTIHIRPNITSYESSILILDATFFGRKGSDTQWGLLVAQDGITGDILASKHIFQETGEDYVALIRTMKNAGYPSPHFAVIDGRNGVETVIRTYYDVPVQICQSHKIATIDRYLLKYPRLESYRALKAIAHDMTKTDKVTFLGMLENFRTKYAKDFEIRELEMKTLKHRYVHPRLHHAYKSLIKDLDRIFVSLDYIETTGVNVNTSNRIESVFSHLKPKVKLHRGLSKERRLSLALSLLWKTTETE